jgi:regulator of protease activity HflC (stomatin/prohibitin superfamily)
MSDTPNTQTKSQEKISGAFSGAFMLLFNAALLLGGIALLAQQFMASRAATNGWIIIGALGMMLLGLVLLGGFFTLQPNEARVLLLFGSYHGTVRQSGFYWANPFYSKNRAQIQLSRREESGDHAKGHASAPSTRNLSSKISLRARNFNSEKLKVNDKRGNPVEIAAVIVWRVEDTAKAAFDVDDFESYVQIQSESAIRHVASLYSYDRSDDDSEPTLRDSADEVALGLQNELQVRLAKAGVTVDEARLTHLAYAPEIAQAMLRRQQAEAVIAARTKIVHGAVSMVDMALKELAEKGVVILDEERKAAMVSNLLVVLCGEGEVTPVVNTGTLYN